MKGKNRHFRDLSQQVLAIETDIAEIASLTAMILFFAFISSLSAYST